MNCKNIKWLLPLYLDAELDDHVAADVAKHLAACPLCQNMLQQYRSDQLVLRSLPPVMPPCEWRSQLFEQLEPIKRPRYGAWRYFVPRLGALAAALMVVLLVSNLLALPAYLNLANVHDQPDQAFGYLQTVGVEEPDLVAVPEVAPDVHSIKEKGSKVDDTTRMGNANLLEGRALIESVPDNSLQTRWWLWSTGLGLALWLTGAWYFYIRYRNYLEKQVE